MSFVTLVLATSIAAATLPPQEPTAAPGADRLLSGWLSELLDLDLTAAKQAYRDVADAEGASRTLRGVALARSIEIARIEGDLEAAREMLQRSTPDREDDRLQQPLAQDLLEGLRQRPPDSDADAVAQWRSEVRRQLSTYTPGRPMRSETRWLLARFADRVDVSDDDQTRVRRLRSQLAEAYRDGEAGRAQQIAESLHRQQVQNRRAHKRLGLQMLDLRLCGAERAAERFARASLVPQPPPLTIGDADLTPTVERLQRSLADLLRAALPIEREILERLRERVGRLVAAGEPRAALELVHGVPFFASALIGRGS